MDPLSVLLDAFIGSAVAGTGRGRAWSPVKEFGWALTIVMTAMGMLGMFLFGDTLHDGHEIGAVLTLLVPYVGTLIAGVAGARGVSNAGKAAVVAVALSVAGGLCLWLMMTVLDLLTWQ